MMTVAGLAAAITGLHDTTLPGLSAQFQTAAQAYIQGQRTLLISPTAVNQAEVGAYAVSDPIAPQFLYQNCGRYQ